MGGLNSHPLPSPLLAIYLLYVENQPDLEQFGFSTQNSHVNLKQIWENK